MPGTQIAVRCGKKAESNAATSAYGRASKRCLSKFSADASGAVLGKIHDRDAVAVAEDKILGRSGGQE